MSLTTTTIAKEANLSEPEGMPPQPRNVEAYVGYCANEAGEMLVGTFPRPGEPTVDVVSWTMAPKLIHDLRGSDDKFTLETAGFQLLRHKSRFEDWTPDEDVRKAYMEEMQEVVQELTGASKALAYDYRLRHLQGPARGTHVDLNDKALFWRLHRAFGDEAHDLIREYRIQAITVWRPFRIVYKDPLAIMDGRSCSQSEFVEYNVRKADAGSHVYETMSYVLVPSDAHRWYYLHEQKEDECWLIKNYDTEDNRGPRFTPHVSFMDKAYEGREKRESVEVRLFVFHEKEIV